MIVSILKYLLVAIVVILILLWFVDGGLGAVDAQFKKFSFSSPWPWVVSSTRSVTGFVTGQGIITLPSVQGVGTTSSGSVQPAPSPQPTNENQNPNTQAEQQQLDQLQIQYQQLRAQAQSAAQ